MPRRDLLRQASMHAAMTISRAPRTFAKEGKSRRPTTTKSKMIIRNGYHEPNNNTAILRLEASMMQTVSQERHPLNRCCALNLRFDRAASEDHGTLPVEPNLGDYPQTPDLRSIAWRSRKQHNAAQYLLHLISFVCCFITRPCRAQVCQKVREFVVVSCLLILQRARLPRRRRRHALAASALPTRRILA